ncbi:hypothetical protein Tco_1517380 [Tanacetum coccineum]
MPRFSSNDMVHNHYIDEARKKTQEKGRNSEPSMMPFDRLQSTTNGSKPKPRINNQKSKSWHASKSSCVTTKTMPIADHHSRNSSNLSDSKHFVCSTCEKCVFNANHDACVTKFLNDVNSRAKVPTGKIFTFSTTKVDSTSINVQEEQTLDLNAGNPFNLTKERIKVWIKENLIFGRPRIHGTTLIQEISARPKS